MRSRIPIRRWAVRGSTAAFAAVTLAAGMQAAATGAQAATHSTSASSVANPYSPAYHHAYRHGVIPTIGQQAKMDAWASSHAGQAITASTNDLNYGGGIGGIGVTTGPERVYLVFWGSQWGTQGTNANGDVTLSGDPNGQAPYLQELFKGLGTGGDKWSGVMTQYCDGVATGSQSCPASNTEHVGYPTGGALAGVWVDESAASPSQATGHQLGQEGVNAAGHFGNTTAISNRDAQYVVVSPTGTHPDGFNTPSGGFCAWHDWNGDSQLTGGAVSSPYGDIAFTNFPYVTDLGASCGQNFVNSGSAGTLDGVSIVEGHEYAETITDQNPAGGWTDSTGYETGDKCAWIAPGSSGGAFNLSLATGSFAMQTTWANDGAGGSGACEASHPIVGNGIINGGFENGLSGWNFGGASEAAVTTAAHSGTYGLQLGLSSPTNGDSTVSQTFAIPPGHTVLSFWYDETCPDSVYYDWATATLKDNTTGATATILGKTCATAGWKELSTSVTAGDSYTLTLTSHDDNYPGDATYTYFDDVALAAPANPIINGGFENGLSGWNFGGASEAAVTTAAHSGTYGLQLGLSSPTNGDSSVSQTFTAATGDTTLSFWYDETCPDSVYYDWATATLKDNTTGATATILGKTCATAGWKELSASVTAGDSYTLTLTSHDDNYPGDATYTYFDDVRVS